MTKSHSETIDSSILYKKKRKRLAEWVKILLAIIIILTSVIYLYLKQPQFASPLVAPQQYGGKFYDGTFHNTEEAPVIESDENVIVSWIKFLTEEQPDAKPLTALPSTKTDLFNLNLSDNIIVWMGHSSYFIQMDGLRLLIDPVFSHNASPVPYTNESFKGSNIYSAADIPEIDYLLISHDHWDHLDYPTIDALKDKVKQVITPIGVGSYLAQWGIAENHIYEGDWYDSYHKEDLEIHILPAQHFSGRLLKRDRTLWSSFAVITKNHKIYLGGDSGYGKHFKEISERLGGFDIAVLETGQYNKNWPFIHMMPEETVQAALDLKAKALLPSHNSKFKLSKHSWYEPLDRIVKASRNQPYQLMTPLIGETIMLDNDNLSFTHWWKHIE